MRKFEFNNTYRKLTVRTINVYSYYLCCLKSQHITFIVSILPKMSPHNLVLISTLRYPSATPIIHHRHHPTSLAFFNFKGCNLVCGTLWPKSSLTRNFNPIGLVVPEIWQNMWEKNHTKIMRFTITQKLLC